MATILLEVITTFRISSVCFGGWYDVSTHHWSYSDNIMCVCAHACVRARVCRMHKQTDALGSPPLSYFIRLSFRLSVCVLHAHAQEGNQHVHVPWITVVVGEQQGEETRIHLPLGRLHFPRYNCTYTRSLLEQCRYEATKNKQQLFLKRNIITNMIIKQNDSSSIQQRKYTDDIQQ